jgi:hypothetical protein
MARYGRWPRILYLPDANHMSGAVNIGVKDDLLSSELLAFVEKFAKHADTQEEVPS